MKIACRSGIRRSLASVHSLCDLCGPPFKPSRATTHVKVKELDSCRLPLFTAHLPEMSELEARSSNLAFLRAVSQYTVHLHNIRT